MLALDGVNRTLRDLSRFNQRSLSTDSSSSILTSLTSGQCISSTVSVLSSTFRTTLNPVQLIAEASFLSLGAVLVIFVLIVVRSISFQLCRPV